LIVRIPDDAGPPREPWTMRRALQAAGVDAAYVAVWQLYGAWYDGLQGTNPLLDSAIPAPPPGVDPSIFVYVALPAAGVGPAFAPPGALETGASSDVFARIDADWYVILEIESEVKGLRKNLHDMTGRLKALNRDLSTDERLYADNQDTRDWVDARRTLRDAGLRLSICLKEVDMGDVSSAGQRAWYEQIYEQFVLPRREFDNMQQAQVNFAYHRKMLATLQINMTNALQNAQNNAERRAQQILNRIAAKIRDGQSRKNFLGVMFD
jgi:hypothetical protein